MDPKFPLTPYDTQYIEVHMYYVLIVRYLIHPNLFVVFQYVRYGNWTGVFLTLAYRVFFSNLSGYLPKSSGGGLFCIICLICIFIVTWLTTAVTWPLKCSKRQCMKNGSTGGTVNVKATKRVHLSCLSFALNKKKLFYDQIVADFTEKCEKNWIFISQAKVSR